MPSRVQPNGTTTRANSLSITRATDEPPQNVGGIASAPAYAAVVVGTSATLVRAAAATRVLIAVENSEGSTGPIVIGFDSSVNLTTTGTTVKRLARLNPGDRWESERYLGAIYAICASGVVATAIYSEVIKDAN
jgi:hypothetical protein